MVGAHHIAGWTYQNKASGVVYSVATTFRSNHPISYPAARAAWMRMRHHPLVSRCLLLAEILDWNDGGSENKEEESVTSLAQLLRGLSTNDEKTKETKGAKE